MISKLLTATAALGLVATPTIAAASGPAAAPLSLSNTSRAHTTGEGNRAGAESIGVILAIGVGAAAVVAGLLVTDDDQQGDPVPVSP